MNGILQNRGIPFKKHLINTMNIGKEMMKIGLS